ncbi:MAG: DUF5667 domain-containing protein [Candidatus Paceibacterota bacterium]|jgi:hypothetical protein
MNTIEEQLNALRKTAMTAGEKDAVRSATASYMGEHPFFVRKHGVGRLQYGTSNDINNHYKVIAKIRMTIAIIIALLLGGGTSFAAENSLPGDILYPVKVHVNENVQEVIAVSNEAEAKLQAKLAVRRLDEAEKLAMEGKLSAETSADLKTRFEEHSESSKEHRIKTEESGKTDAAASISSDTEVSLEMHKKLLEDMEESKPEMKGFLGGILDGVRVYLKESGDNRAEIETKVFAGEGSDEKAAAEGVLSAAQNKIEEAKKYVEKQKANVSAETRAEANARIDAAVAAVAEGKAKIEVEAYADAFALFKKAAREAEMAKRLMSARYELNLEVKTGKNETEDANNEKSDGTVEDNANNDKNDTGDNDGNDENNTSKGEDGCFVGGCSGQICSGEKNVITTCEMKSEYACYKEAKCERQPDGKCGWTQNAKLKQCLSVGVNVEIKIGTPDVNVEVNGEAESALGL